MLVDTDGKDIARAVTAEMTKPKSTVMTTTAECTSLWAEAMPREDVAIRSPKTMVTGSVTGKEEGINRACAVDSRRKERIHKPNSITEQVISANDDTWFK
jgi:hypothetical protein